MASKKSPRKSEKSGNRTQRNIIGHRCGGKTYAKRRGTGIKNIAEIEEPDRTSGKEKLGKIDGMPSRLSRKQRVYTFLEQWHALKITTERSDIIYYRINQPIPPP